MKAWCNGRAISPDAPCITVLDRGFTLADGLFETMRSHRGAIFRRDAHLARLGVGATLLGIPLPADLRDVVATVARESGYEDASVRLTVTRGPAPPGLLPPVVPTPTVTLICTPISPPAVPKPLVATMARARRNEYALTAGVKTLSYTESLLALAEAQAAGADDALFLDTAGHLSEATASNLFAFIDDELVTPPLGCGVLPGITRAAVLELASVLGIGAVEREIAEPELAAATEIFLTSSIREIVPVVRIGTTAIGTGQNGPHTVRIIDAYRALVRLECAS